MRRFVAVSAAVALVVAVALTVVGCGGGETVEPPPEDWDRVWSSPDEHDPEVIGAVFDVPGGGYVRILVEQTDPTHKYALDLNLVSLEPQAARGRTIDLGLEPGEDLWDFNADEAATVETASLDLRTPEEVPPGEYRLEWTGTGKIDVTVLASP